MATDAVKPSKRLNWIFNKSPYFVVLFIITLILITFFGSRFFVKIDSGEAGVLYRLWSGTQVDVIYGEGLHIISPFNTMNIYETRKQVALHKFPVLSKKGLKVKLSLAVRYQPEYTLLGILHKKIGPDYLNRVILPQIESVMRKQLGKYDAEQIFTNEEGLLTNTILMALDEVGKNYVKVSDIIIRSLELPDSVVAAIDAKLVHKQKEQSYEFRLKTAEKEAKRLEIEAYGIKKYNKIISSSLDKKILLNKGINATKELSQSNNSKVVIIGSGDNGLPLILGGDHTISIDSMNKSTLKQDPIDKRISANNQQGDNTNKP